MYLQNFEEFKIITITNMIDVYPKFWIDVISIPITAVMNEDKYTL